MSGSALELLVEEPVVPFGVELPSALIFFMGESMPLVHARAKCEHLERELRKSPDFQLYLLSRSRKDRVRMERVLMRIPGFKLWHELMNSIAIGEVCTEPAAIGSLMAVASYKPATRAKQPI
jgi:hypothetical protein